MHSKGFFPIYNNATEFLWGPCNRTVNVTHLIFIVKHNLINLILLFWGPYTRTVNVTHFIFITEHNMINLKNAYQLHANQRIFMWIRAWSDKTNAYTVFSYVWKYLKTCISVVFFLCHDMQSLNLKKEISIQLP